MMGDAARMANIMPTKMNRIVVVSPSSSGSSSRSSDSDVEAEPCGGITGEPRPSIHLHRTPMRDLRSGHHIIVTKGGRGDFGPPRVSSHAMQVRGLERGQEAQKKHERRPGQDRNAIDVVVRQARCCNTDPRFKAVLFSIGILCPPALGSWLWTLVHQYDLLGTNSQSSAVDPADSPLFSGCEEMACQVYMGALESTLNRTQDPCKDPYRFLCDGWKHCYHLSVVDTTEEAVCSRALQAILWPRFDQGNGELFSSDARGVEQKVIGFARSCMHFAESSLGDVKKFMADGHLPWPNASRWDLLEALLDLSGNWNLYLWFQVVFEIAPFRGGTVEPVLRISHSAAFRTWISHRQ